MSLGVCNISHVCLNIIIPLDPSSQKYLTTSTNYEAGQILKDFRYLYVNIP